MFMPSQIREIAKRQRQRGVEVVCVKTDHDSIRIRIAARGTLPGAAAAAPSTEPARLTVRSERLGTAVLSGAPALAKAWQNGDAVDEGQVLAFIELGEARHAVLSPSRATVDAVLVQAGQRVDYGMPLFELTPEAGAAA